MCAHNDQMINALRENTISVFDIIRWVNHQPAFAHGTGTVMKDANTFGADLDNKI